LRRRNSSSSLCFINGTRVTLTATRLLRLLGSDMACHTRRCLAASDASSYRELRLKGLRTHPEAFSSSWEDESSRPLDWFAERLEGSVLFGAHFSVVPALIGVVGLHVPKAVKLKHKGVLGGMFVQPEFQGTELGTA
jgi:hypothetical protein